MVAGKIVVWSEECTREGVLEVSNDAVVANSCLVNFPKQTVPNNTNIVTNTTNHENTHNARESFEEGDGKVDLSVMATLDRLDESPKQEVSFSLVHLVMEVG